MNYEAEPTTTGTAANAAWILVGGSVYSLRFNTSSRKYKSEISYDVDYLADIELKPTKHWRLDDKQYRYAFVLEDLVDEDPLLSDGETPNSNALLAVLSAKIIRLEKMVLS